MARSDANATVHYSVLNSVRGGCGVTCRTVCFVCLGLTLACSDAQNAGGFDTTGGGSANGGTTSTADTTQGGGPTNGGATSTGGRSAVVPGNPCTGNCPAGPIFTCLSTSNCPLGGCNGVASCQAVYGAPAGPDTVYCAQSQTGEYCFTTFDTVGVIWRITCADGTPTASLCPHGCGVSQAGVVGCT